MVTDYMSPILTSMLDEVKKRVTQKDMDWVCVVDGRERSGKSVLAQQIAHYLDPTFDIKQIVFNAEEFKHAVIHSHKFQAIVFDEAYNSSNARAAMSEITRELIALSTEMGQQNLFILICLPSFFDLDRTFALHRSSSLIHVYFDKEWNRGQAVIFPYDQKRNLYLYGKKMYNYFAVKSPYAPIAFSNRYEVDETAYRQRKRETLGETYITSNVHRDIFMNLLIEKNGWDKNYAESIQRISTEYGITPLSKIRIWQIRGDYKRKYGNKSKETNDKTNPNGNSDSSVNAIRNESSNGIQIQPNADPAAV